MTPDIDHAAISAPLTGPGYGFSPITGTIEETVQSWFSEPRNRGSDFARRQREALIVEDVRLAMLPRSHRFNAQKHKLGLNGRDRRGKVGKKGASA
jgi:hypothetical protein